MTEPEFELLDNFNWNEKTVNGGFIRDEIYLLNADYMDRLDWAVSRAKESHGPIAGQFVIYYLTKGSHVEHSYHYQGRAADGYFKGLNL